MRNLILAAVIVFGGLGCARADMVGDALANNLYAGTLQTGDSVLGAIIDKGDPATLSQAQSARGLLQFVRAVEHLSQSLYLYGLETHPGDEMMQLPILRVPVEPNPHPEKIDYQKYRAILQDLFDDLNQADAQLAQGAKGEGVKLPLDLAKVRIDMNKDGKANSEESVGLMLEKILRSPTGGTIPDLNFNFDKADLLWLRGYIQFLTASAEFGLAIDFEDSFNKTGHAFFPKSGLPMSDILLMRSQSMRFVDNSVGDALALVHLMNWKVSDPQRFDDVRLRLIKLAELSPESWKAARAETDNDREWLPNAKQTGRWGAMAVDDATINGWLAVVSEFKQVLEGTKLAPHWRFEQGINVKRLFQETKRLDIVLLIAGVDTVPFLESGPMSTTADWHNLTSLFRGNFLGYALWFN